MTNKTVKNPYFSTDISAKSIKPIFIAVFSMAVIFITSFGVIGVKTANAFDPLRLIDPFCIFADCDEEVIYQTVNTNSNVNSPGAIVNVENNNGSGSGADYNSGSNGYNYNNDDLYGRFDASCSPNTTVGEVGDRITWRAYGYGGNGSYTYEWDGDEGLDGSGSSQTIRYDREGSKSAEVTVRSGSKTITRTCNQDVYIYDNDYDRGYDRDYDRYDDDRYDRDYDYYGPLSVSCTPNTTFTSAGNVVSWTAYASGGNGRYSYRWDGTDGLRGGSQTVSYIYSDGGQKVAEVRVTSGGRSITRSCSNTVTIGIPVSTIRPNVQIGLNQGGNIQSACFADRVNGGIGSTVTWAVEVSGGNGAYSYIWSGSDGLSGSSPFAVKSYSSSGVKTASVTVIGGGETRTISCGNSVSILSQGNGGGSNGSNSSSNNSNRDNDTKNQSSRNDSNFFAASIFSLGNVPWGWVAILVILVLFTMVMYLLFNRNKI